MRNHFFKTRKKTKNMEHNQCKKGSIKKETVKTEFFDGKEKTEKESFAAFSKKVHIFWHSVLHKET